MAHEQSTMVRLDHLEDNVEKLTARLETHHDYIVSSKALMRAALVLVPVLTAILVAALNMLWR